MIATRRGRAARALAAAAGPVLGAAAGAGAAVLTRRRRRAGSGGGPGPETWRCACGQEFRVSGLERHRVYWLADAPENDPVVSGQCPSCDRPLPANGASAR